MQYNLDDLKREVGQLIQDRAMDFSYPVKLEIDQGAYIAKYILDYLHAQGRIVLNGYVAVPLEPKSILFGTKFSLKRYKAMIAAVQKEDVK